MQQWAPIEVADALELLSPDFKNDEVRAHAVATLQAKDDDELLYYLLQVRLLLWYCIKCYTALWMPVHGESPRSWLDHHGLADSWLLRGCCCCRLCMLLQLVQALRFEAFDDSRLARFLVARSAANPAFAIFLHWWVDMRRSLLP
jgi:phosphatidylinositol 3-kinase